MAFAAGILIFSARLHGIPDPASDGHQGYAIDGILVGGVLLVGAILWQLVRQLRSMNRELDR